MPTRMKTKLAFELLDKYYQKFYFFFNDLQGKNFADKVFIRKVLTNLDCQMYECYNNYIVTHHPIQTSYMQLSMCIDSISFRVVKWRSWLETESTFWLNSLKDHSLVTIRYYLGCHQTTTMYHPEMKKHGAWVWVPRNSYKYVKTFQGVSWFFVVESADAQKPFQVHWV